MASKKRSLFHRKFTLFQIGIFLLILVMVPVGIVLADGEAGFALSFDGIDDYVLLGKTNTIMGGTSWQSTKTVSMWIKPEGTAVVCENPDPAWCDSIFGDRPRWWGVSRGILESQDRIWVWNKYGESASAIDKIGVKYVSGEWFHLALVHNNGLFTVYKNGELVEQISSGTTAQPTTAGAEPDLQLGAVINNADRNWSFQGEIDEVRLYTIALTHAQIQSDLFQEIVGSESGLAAYYRMSDGTGLRLSNNRLLSGGIPMPTPTSDNLLEWAAPGETPVAPPPQWVDPSTAFDKPIVHDKFIEMNEDAAGVSITLTGFDKQDDILTYVASANLTLGVLSGSEPNLTFTPYENANGSESFTYTAMDGSHTSGEGIVEILINPINDIPIANNLTVTTPVGTKVTIPVSGSDVDLDPLTYKRVVGSGPSYGVLNSNTFEYTPFAGFAGVDTFYYQADDGLEKSLPALVTITVGGAPVLSNAVYLPLLIR